MSETKHTPGPWMVKHAGSADEIWSDRGMVAEVSLYPHGGQIAGANSRLVAAAPELLEALDMLADAVESDRYELSLERATRARAAIAKAKGEA